MAMVNYPYATNFIRPLPAWPVEQSCLNAAGVKDEELKDARDYSYQNIMRLAAMMQVWQGGQCLNLVGSNETGALDGAGWEIQTCSELPMPQGDDPAQSAYTWTNWYEDEWTAYCMDAYEMVPQYDWALDFFGGREPRRDFLDYTNIVWVNGEYDPWHGGGITTNITSGTTAIMVKKAAHHYDLRAPHANDTIQIQEARNIETMHLKNWIANWQMNIMD